jgi:hypothetical protein
MADTEWFEIPGEGQFPNREEALKHAREVARGTDRQLDIYRVRRNLVRTVQREVKVNEYDVPTP